MSDYKSKTIREVINDINERRMFLPSIQRNFVWSNEQITNLMDSIMREYPIGTFLFWEIDKKTLNDEEYTLYEFLNKYHERDSYLNSLAPAPYMPKAGEDDRTSFVTAVLDGQQRLTSLYLALQGTIARKEPYAKAEDDKSYKEKELYFNLYSNSSRKNDDDDDEVLIAYEFKFLEKSESSNRGDKLWYRVKDILRYTQSDIYGIVSDMVKNMSLSDAEIKLIGKNLARLQSQLVENKVINFFNAKADHEHGKFTTLDEVTDIFVRINSGGTKLNKSDLLFSRIVSVWNDAREEIQNIVRTLNSMRVYSFDNDFIIKASLMIIGCSSKLKVTTLTTSNIKKIKENWNEIKNSIVDAKCFLEKNGFVHETIGSYNAILPLILYRYKYGQTQFSQTKNEKAMKNYFVIAQVENLFGKSQNSVLDRLQKVIENLGDKADFPGIANFGFNKSFDKNMINDWFEFEKGPNTFIILSLLYQECRFDSRKFHQDHMHPYSAFEINEVVESIHGVYDRNDNELCSLNDKKSYLKHQRNKLANLQLLEGPENTSKNATPLCEWLNKGDNRNHTKYLPKNTDCKFPIAEFESFMKERQILMANALCEILGIKDNCNAVDCIGADVNCDNSNENVRKRRKNTRFIDLGIVNGEIITYCWDENITARVVDDNKVLYNNERYSLSSLTKKLLNNNQNVNGFKNWKYNGKLLYDIRNELNLLDASDDI